MTATLDYKRNIKGEDLKYIVTAYACTLSAEQENKITKETVTFQCRFIVTWPISTLFLSKYSTLHSSQF